MKKLIALLLCVALSLSFSVPVTATGTQLGAAGEMQERTEIISKREVYSKTYLLPDGTYQYVSYAEPIHYQDSVGNYVEINNKISDAVRAEGYKFTNTSNSWNVHFSDKITDENAVKMTDGEYEIAFSFAGQVASAPVARATDIAKTRSTKQLSQYHKALSTDDRAVIYTDVADRVDIAYTVRTGALKEDIILNAKPASGVFKFKLTTNGLILKEKAGTVALYDALGKEIFEFAPLYMEDATGKRSNSVSLAYSSVKNGYELTVTADAEFLNAPDTVYPVVIDPSVMVTGENVTFDTYVSEEYPEDNNNWAESSWTGGKKNINAMRTYMKFAMPSDVYASQVTSAYINILKKDYQVPTIKAYRVTADWSSSEVTWNTKPSFSTQNYSSVAANTTGDWYSLDITNMVACWLSGAWPNYGVILKEPSESVSEKMTEFYATDAPPEYIPKLVINYISVINVAQLVGVYAGENHNHESSLLGAQVYLENMGYTVPSVHTGSFTKEKIQSYLNDNINTIFISRSHGAYYTSNGIQQYTCIDIGNNVLFTSNTDMSTLDLSNMKLIMFIGCATGRGGEYSNNLPSRAIELGATTAIGFSGNIDCALANAWLLQFMQLMEYGYLVGDACTFLQLQATFVGSGLEEVVVCGEANAIIS